MTQALKSALSQMAEVRQHALKEAWWAGRTVTENDRLTLRMIEQFTEDFFETDENDLKEAMRKCDEYKRNSPKEYKRNSTDALQGAGQAHSG